MVRKTVTGSAMAKARRPTFSIARIPIDFARRIEDIFGWVAGHSERRGTEVPDHHSGEVSSKQC